MTNEQKLAVAAIVGTVTEPMEDAQHSDEGGNEMKHNVFDKDGNHFALLVACFDIF